MQPHQIALCATRHTPLHPLIRAAGRQEMASRVTVKRMQQELKRRGLPIYGNKSALLERCRVNGVSCSTETEADGSPATPNNRVEVPDRPSASGSTIVPAAGQPNAGGPARVGGHTQADAAGWPTAAPSAQRGPVGTTVLVPPASSPAPAEPAPPAARSAAAAGGGASGRAPPFSKHEKVRLAHVLCSGEVAAGVVVSRGPMSRRQQDARVSRDRVWVVVVEEMFNSADQFTEPTECVDCELEPNVHPHVRTGLLLKAKWSEVRCASYASFHIFHCLVRGASCASFHIFDCCTWRFVRLFSLLPLFSECMRASLPLQAHD